MEVGPLSKNNREPFTIEDLERMFADFCRDMDLDTVYGADMGPGSAEIFIKWLKVKRDRGMKHRVEMHELF